MENGHRQDPNKWNLGKSIDSSREVIATCDLLPPGQI